MELSSHWAKALEPNILEWIHEGFLEHPDSTTEIFDVINESRGIIRFHDSYGPRVIPKSSEGADTTELNLQKAYETTAVPQIFKGKLATSAENARWGQYREIQQYATDLGRSMMQSLNLFANSAFIEAFTSTSTSYGDAKAKMSNWPCKIHSYFGKAQRWVTLTKQIIYLQVQRLSEWTLYERDATVRTATII